jgi:hypothetical protein
MLIVVLPTAKVGAVKAAAGATIAAAIIATTATTPKILNNLLFIDFSIILLNSLSPHAINLQHADHYKLVSLDNLVTSAYYTDSPWRVISTNITSLTK